MDTLFFIASKTVGILARADSWPVIAVALIAVAAWRGGARRTGMAAGAMTAALVALGLLPLGQWLIAGLEARQWARPALTAPVAGIVVLGGGEDVATSEAAGGIPQLNSAGERLTEAVYLARLHPQARIVVSGGRVQLGQVPEGAVTGADVMARFLVEQGVAPARILREGRSRNTAENAAFSLAVAQPGDGEQWLLVTSAFHMDRALRSFGRAGWQGIIAWPVDFRARDGGIRGGGGWSLARNLMVLSMATREYVGLVAYDLKGW